MNLSLGHDVDILMVMETWLYAQGDAYFWTEACWLGLLFLSCADLHGGGTTIVAENALVVFLCMLLFSKAVRERRSWSSL